MESLHHKDKLYGNPLQGNRPIYVKGQRAKPNQRNRARPKSATTRGVSRAKDLTPESFENVQNNNLESNSTKDCPSKSIQDSKDVLEHALKELKEANFHLRAQLVESNDSHEALSIENRSLQVTHQASLSQLVELQKENAKQANAIAELQNQNHKLGALLTTGGNQLQMQNEAHESAVMCAVEESNRLKAALDTARTRIETVQHEKFELEKKFHEKFGECEALMDKRRELESSGQDSNEKRAALESKVLELEKELEEVKSRSRMMERCGERISDKIAEKDVQLGEMRNNLESVSKELEEKTRQSERYEAQIEEKENQMQCMEAMLENKRAELGSKNSQIEKQLKVIESMHEKEKQITRENSNRLADQKRKDTLIQHLKDKIEHLTGQYQLELTNKFDKQRMIKTLADRIKTLSSKISFLQDKLRYSQDIRTDAVTQLQRLSDGCARMLQYADAMHDEKLAAMESNEILSVSLGLHVSAGGRRSAENSLALGRENYALSTPFSVPFLRQFLALNEELTGDTSKTRALSKKKSGTQHQGMGTFKVVKASSSVVSRESYAENCASDGIAEDGDSSNTIVYELAALKGDKSGQTFLKRTKINLFLRFCQGRCTKNRFRQLILKKVAELVSTLRNQQHESLLEHTQLRASYDSLYIELQQCKRNLNAAQQQQQGTILETNGPSTEKVLTNLHKKFTAGVLHVLSTRNNLCHTSNPFQMGCCGVQDLHLHQLLLALESTPAFSPTSNSFHEEMASKGSSYPSAPFALWNLDDNEVSDTGAQMLASFLIKHWHHFQHLHFHEIYLTNNRITWNGVQAFEKLIRSGAQMAIEVLFDTKSCIMEIVRKQQNSTNIQPSCQGLNVDRSTRSETGTETEIGTETDSIILKSNLWAQENVILRVHFRTNKVTHREDNIDNKVQSTLQAVNRKLANWTFLTETDENVAVQLDQRKEPDMKRTKPRNVRKANVSSKLENNTTQPLVKIVPHKSQERSSVESTSNPRVRPGLNKSKSTQSLVRKATSGSTTSTKKKTPYGIGSTQPKSTKKSNAASCVAQKKKSLMRSKSWHSISFGSTKREPDAATNGSLVSKPSSSRTKYNHIQTVRKLRRKKSTAT